MKFLNYDQARQAVLGYERWTGIDELPVEFAETAIDKLPKYDIIYCKECLYWDAEEEVCENHDLCMPKTRQYDYCSFAESNEKKEV